jgi:lysophospholipase L1-like esterase
MKKRPFFLSLLLFAAPVLADDEGVRIHTDWPWLARYHDQDQALLAAGKKTDVVFIGDSITELWVGKRPGFFSEGRVGRGISGQTTPQMLLRFRQDVVALHPKLVHIMAGTNDVAGNTGPMTAEMTKDNIMDMVEIAKANNIKVILASIPPADHFPWKPGVETVKRITELNDWLKGYAASQHLVYADYWTAMQNGQGGMKDGLAFDGVHPTEAGYDVMAGVAELALKRASGGR